MRHLVLLFFVLIAFSTIAQKSAQETKQFVSELDEQIPQLLHDFMVPGAAMAIIENGEVILKKGYGYADVEIKKEVTISTGFNIGSISKTVAAWGVMKLVEQGKLDLDAPAEKYLTRWHLPESDFDANEVTLRRLLSHTAGLSLHGYPGWSPQDQLPTIEESLNGKNNGPGRVEMIMPPGTRWKYSGGGFSILQLIIEEVTGQRFEDFMQLEVLNPLGMTNSSYTIDEKIMEASSKEHNGFGEVIAFELFTAQAAAGLHTTIDDFTKFALASLHSNEKVEKQQKVLNSIAIKDMMEPAPASNGRYGLGYQLDSIDRTSVTLRGHGGANSGWHAFLRVDPVKNDGFIMITNGGAGYNIYRQVFCDWITWKHGVSMGDRCNIKKPIASKLKQILEQEGVNNVTQRYSELKEREGVSYNFSEDQLNQLGYYYLGEDQVDIAIVLFKINVEAFPHSSNVYDSYGEALLKKGDREGAIENYKKSVELNPGNEGGIKILNDLGLNTDELTKELIIDDQTLQKYVGNYEIAPDFIISVYRKGDQMMAKATGQDEAEIFARTENIFYLKVVEAQLIFNLDTEGVVENLTLVQGGREQVGSKLKD